MNKRFGVLVAAVFAFAVFPAVAMAGESDPESDKRAERIAAKQTQVDSFVACLNATLDPDVPAIDVEAILSERSLTHRGWRGFGHRGLGGRGDEVNRVARFVVRAGELDRTDQNVRDAVKSCRDAARETLAATRQADVQTLADCLVREGQAVEVLALADRPRIASKRGYLRRSARVMLRSADISLRDADVRGDMRTCVKEVKAAASA
jgi:hypothetical protein